jgi:Uri superfamily endonuclease
VGSALRGLQARVARHLRREKKIRWHIDCLLERGAVMAVLWIHSEERLECVIAQGLRDRGLASIKGFGASDCRCPSHLFHHLSKEGLKLALVEAFRQAAGPPRSLEVAV